MASFLRLHQWWPKDALARARLARKAGLARYCARLSVPARALTGSSSDESPSSSV